MRHVTAPEMVGFGHVIPYICTDLKILFLPVFSVRNLHLHGSTPLSNYMDLNIWTYFSTVSSLASQTALRLTCLHVIQPSCRFCFLKIGLCFTGFYAADVMTRSISPNPQKYSFHLHFLFFPFSIHLFVLSSPRVSSPPIIPDSSLQRSVRSTPMLRSDMYGSGNVREVILTADHLCHNRQPVERLSPSRLSSARKFIEFGEEPVQAPYDTETKVLNWSEAWVPTRSWHARFGSSSP